MKSLKILTDEILSQEETIRQGGGPKGIERQRRLSRLIVRERLDLLLDKNFPFFELGIWAGYQMYERWGGLPAAGVICGIGTVAERKVMVIANEKIDAAPLSDIYLIPNLWAA